MRKAKLTLEKIEIESFEIVETEEERGTVEANMMATAVGGTCRGQTVLCTACTPYVCGA